MRFQNKIILIFVIAIFLLQIHESNNVNRLVDEQQQLLNNQQLLLDILTPDKPSEQMMALYELED